MGIKQTPNTKKTPEQLIEAVHANAAYAVSNRADKTEISDYFTLCMINADCTDDNCTVNIRLSAEAHKDMGTEDPADDEYYPLHTESIIDGFKIDSFESVTKNIIDMYGSDRVKPIITEETQMHYNIPDNYTFEDMFAILKDISENGTWELSDGIGFLILEVF